MYEKDKDGKLIETKNDFAKRVIAYAHEKGINPLWVNFDSKYSSSKLLNRINDFKWIYYTQLP